MPVNLLLDNEWHFEEPFVYPYIDELQNIPLRDRVAFEKYDITDNETDDLHINDDILELVYFLTF